MFGAAQFETLRDQIVGRFAGREAKVKEVEEFALAETAFERRITSSARSLLWRSPRRHDCACSIPNRGADLGHTQTWRCGCDSMRPNAKLQFEHVG